MMRKIAILLALLSFGSVRASEIPGMNASSTAAAASEVVEDVDRDQGSNNSSSNSSGTLVEDNTKPNATELVDEKHVLEEAGGEESSNTSVSQVNSETVLVDDHGDDDDDGLIRANPSYVGPAASEEEAEGETEDDVDLDTHHHSDDQVRRRRKLKSKAKLAKALAKQKTARRARNRKAVVVFLRKHQTTLALGVMAYAFRKELKHFFKKVFSKTIVLKDAETGELLLRESVVQLNGTDVLKILLFGYVLLRMLLVANKPDGDNNCESSDATGTLSTLALLMLNGRFLSPTTLLLLLPMLLSSPSKSSIYLPPVEQHYTFESLNSRYTKDGMALHRALETAVKERRRRKQKAEKSESLASFLSPKRSTEKTKAWSPFNGTTVLLDMTKLDSTVSQIGTIRDKVSFILSEFGKFQESSGSSGAHNNNSTKVEVAVLLESPGGSAPDYALAAQQLLRLRNHPDITVTILVDKVAASGGYMIACTSSPGQLYAAPFAILGSIGVVGQAVNIQKTLEGWGVQPLVFKGGRDKAPIGMLGDITEEGLAKVQDMVDTTHRAFQRHVVESRPVLAETIQQVATGETWLGYDAIEIGLCDKIITSDEYIRQKIDDGTLVLKLLQVQMPKSSLFRPATEGIDFGSQTNSNGRFSLGALCWLLLSRTSQWMQKTTQSAWARKLQAFAI